MHGVDGRVVLITGAGQGIGRGIAHHLGKHGASIVVAERKPHRIERVVGELTDLGVAALGVQTDILSRDSIDGMVTATLDCFGRVDALINNAHTFTARTTLADASAEDVDVNHGTTKGVLYAMQAVYPHMAAAGWGRIVNLVPRLASPAWRATGRTALRRKRSAPSRAPRRASGATTASSSTRSRPVRLHVGGRRPRHAPRPSSVRCSEVEPSNAWATPRMTSPPSPCSSAVTPAAT